MATGKDKKVVELDPASPLTGAEEFYAVQDSGDRRVAVSAVVAAAKAAVVEVPPGGTAGQVLESDANGAPHWSDTLKTQAGNNVTLTAAVAKAGQDATDALANAATADRRAGTAIAKADAANAKATSAQDAADTAQEDAFSAQETADQALLIANDASATIQSTQEIALAAQSKAADAKSVADHALAVANAGGGGGTGAVPIKELPDYPDTAAAGQVLVVGADGASVAWSAALSSVVHNLSVAMTTATAAKTASATADGKAETADAKAVAAQHTADQALAAANSGGGSGAPIKELPDYPSTDAAGQVLVVNQAGTGVEWSKQLGTVVAEVATKITMGEENTLPSAKTTLVLDSGSPEFGLKNSAGELALELKADGSAGLMSKLGTTAHSLILFMASGSYSIAGGRISINSGGTVTLQVPPAGTASGNEAATAGFVLARLKAKTDTIDASIAGLTTATTTAQTTADAAKTTADAAKAKADSSVQNVKGGSGIWVGTQAEFDAIGTKDDTNLYFIKG